MRDIRQFYLTEYQKFKTNNNCDFQFRNKTIKDKFIPFQMKEFAKNFFDQEMIETIIEETKDTSFN